MFRLLSLRNLAKRPPPLNNSGTVQPHMIGVTAAAAAAPPHYSYLTATTTTGAMHDYHSQLCHTQTRRGMAYAATPSLSMSLDEFRDPIPRQQRMSETVGRSWSAKELRRKSFDDLHKLWIVLYKERNMLLTEQQLSRRRQIIFPQPERLRKVGKSMGAIRQVLGERKRERLHQRLIQKEEEEKEEGDGKEATGGKDGVAETAKATSAEA